MSQTCRFASDEFGRNVDHRSALLGQCSTANNTRASLSCRSVEAEGFRMGAGREERFVTAVATEPCESRGAARTAEFRLGAKFPNPEPSSLRRLGFELSNPVQVWFLAGLASASHEQVEGRYAGLFRGDQNQAVLGIWVGKRQDHPTFAQADADIRSAKRISGADFPSRKKVNRLGLRYCSSHTTDMSLSCQKCH